MVRLISIFTIHIAILMMMNMTMIMMTMVVMMIPGHNGRRSSAGSRGSGGSCTCYQVPSLSTLLLIIINIFIISCVSVYHCLIEIQQRKATLSNFSNSSVSNGLKRPNMCDIFEKHGIQGYQIRHPRVPTVKYTNMQIQSA